MFNPLCFPNDKASNTKAYVLISPCPTEIYHQAHIMYNNAHHSMVTKYAAVEHISSL